MNKKFKYNGLLVKKSSKPTLPIVQNLSLWVENVNPMNIPEAIYKVTWS